MHMKHRFMFLLAATLVVASPAFGQGTKGMVPSPITAGNLDSYIDRLDLSPLQQAQFEAMYESYWHDFSRLRDNEIEEYLQLRREKIEDSQSFRNPENVQDVIDALDRLMVKIARVDRSLFDRIDPFLSEEQRRTLQRVRLSRARDRFSSSRMTAFGPRILDLSDAYFEANITPDTEMLMAIDAILEGYEQQLTLSVEAYYRRNAVVMMDIFKELEDLGFSKDTAADRELREDYSRALGRLWNENMQSVQMMASDINARSQASYTTLASMLEGLDKSAIRQAWYSRAYPDTKWLVSDDSLSMLAELQSIPDLSQDARERLESEGAAFAARMEQLIGKAMASIRDDWNGDGIGGTIGANNQIHKDVKESVYAEFVEAREKLDEAVEWILEEEEVGAAWQGRSTRQDTKSAAKDLDTREPGEWNGIPRPIGRTVLHAIAEQLQLQPEDMSVLESLLASYHEGWEADAQLARDRVSIGHTHQWKKIVEKRKLEDVEESEQRSRDAARARRTAMGLIRGHDIVFFSQVALVYGDTPERASSLEILERQRYLQSLGMEPSDESRLGKIVTPRLQEIIARCADDGLLGQTHLVAIQPALRLYLDAACSIMERVREARIALEEASALGYLGRVQRGERGWRSWRAVRSSLSPYRSTLNDHVQDYRRVSLNSLAEMKTALPELEADLLQAAYDQSAYPSVFHDPLSLLDPLSRCLNLTELAPAQVEELRGISLEYQGAYGDLCQQWISLLSPDGVMPGPDSRQERTRVDRIRFERDELSLRTSRRLSSILTPQQILVIGGLPGLHAAE